MPYTPPSQQSPAVSKPSSPSISRSQSYLKTASFGSDSSLLSSRPGLPRSTGSVSYLSKHRRSPSISKGEESHGSLPTINGDAAGYDHVEQNKIDPHGSLRQSPPPISKMLIPTGATISPPESPHNSSDDEGQGRGRGRDLDNLAELQALIRTIEQKKAGSPTRDPDENRRARIALDLAGPNPENTLSTPTNTVESSRPPLSREARKISHSRSSTDSNIILDLGRQAQSPLLSKQDTDEDEDEDSSDEAANRSKPAMVRKKSGELVRPALRASSSRRRPSSMPGTPTYSKAVHFDSHLEHVRHFLQVDKPLAVSASSSPVENCESELDFPFGQDDTGHSRYQWEIRVSNFPDDSDHRRSLPVRVERVFLSVDNKNLIGTIAVQNLAFHKTVAVRFTLDYWKTTSEVIADFNHDVRRMQSDGCDRFNFNIKLADLANLENKTMFFCVRYSVNGQDYWDNNSNMNFQVDFAKKAKPQPGKNGMRSRPLNALPRSKPAAPMTAGNFSTLPTSFDDFAAGLDAYSSFGQSPAAIMGDSPIKLKNPRNRAGMVPDAPTRRTKTHAQAFGNRYDFGASLSAAIQNASAFLGEQSGLKLRLDTKQSSHEVPAPSNTGRVKPQPEATNTAKAPAGRLTSFKPAALISEKPSLSSQSYQELVDKYCFYGSSKPSPRLTKTSLAMVDGAYDDTSVSDVSIGSAKSDTSGSSTPTPPRTSSPPSLESPPTTMNSQLSRSTSPVPRTGSGLGSRTASPVSFGFPFHSPSPSGFFSGSPASAIIQG